MEWVQRFISNIKNFGLEYYGKYYGTYKAIVQDNNDPEQRGRLKIECPTVYGQNIYEYWALPKGIITGLHEGLFAIPNIGDNIWVCFEGGDVTSPIWEYGYWNNNNQIEGIKKDYPNIQIWQTGAIKIELDRTKNQISLITENGKRIQLNETTISFGSENKSDQFAIMGEDAVKNMQDISKVIKDTNNILSSIVQVIVTYSLQQEIITLNPPLTPLSAGYKKLGLDLTQQLPDILKLISEIEVLSKDFPNSLSEVVSLDKK